MKKTIQTILMDETVITATQYSGSLGISFCFTYSGYNPPDVIDAEAGDFYWIEKDDLPAFIGLLQEFLK